ncbi:MAG: DUF47 family protein [Elusimicrobiota bacterium]
MLLADGNKEKQVVEALNGHINNVENSLENLVYAIKFYLNGDIAKSRGCAFKVHSFESAADIDRRRIIQLLYEGAFMPIYREGLVDIVAKLDKVADHAESSSDFLVVQKPDIPEQFKEEIIKLNNLSANSFKPLKAALKAIFSKGKKILRDNVREINAIESDIDRLEWELISRIYSSDMELDKKIHLGEFIWHIADISDTCQDTADAIEYISVRK